MEPAQVADTGRCHQQSNDVYLDLQSLECRLFQTLPGHQLSHARRL
ncbi:MAG: hypothetical protein VW647_05515 [Alphaproteobacteria bacterium]